MFLPSLGVLASEAFLREPKEALKKFKETCFPGYAVQVSHMTQFDLERMKAALVKLDLPSGVSIFTTGSDAKLEKSSRKESPIELIVFCDGATRPVVEEKINHLIKTCLIPLDPLIEWKDEKTDSLVNCDITKVIIPSRFLHKFQLLGTSQHEDELTNRFVTELSQMKSTKRDKFRKQFVTKHYNQLIRVLEGKENGDVDLANGVISYSGTGKKATKYSLLRPIQYALDLVLIDSIRKNVRTPEEFVKILQQMPKQVPDQIDYMSKCGFLPNLSSEDVQDLKRAYALGQLYFQTAQHLITNSNGRPVEFQIPDKEELRKAYQDTARILKKL